MDGKLLGNERVCERAVDYDNIESNVLFHELVLQRPVGRGFNGPNYFSKFLLKLLHTDYA